MASFAPARRLPRSTILANFTRPLRVAAESAAFSLCFGHYIVGGWLSFRHQQRERGPCKVRSRVAIFDTSAWLQHLIGFFYHQASSTSFQAINGPSAINVLCVSIRYQEHQVTILRVFSLNSRNQAYQLSIHINVKTAGSSYKQHYLQPSRKFCLHMRLPQSKLNTYPNRRASLTQTISYAFAVQLDKACAMTRI
ncbi:hypothetical protein HBI56_159020 [Parastagonospora nodorum]|uniref:Uncharacterized protein n=1 Tax=Phaeosphaeria nodorum (strain SN15 / ATCC MYA-4574 / FGSC 10173) TaxID=321614 RepID=A0A7U2ESN7_PHANO|nr:hypothetical protein HBH56_189740 [Parastagonospora nodorum]QRC92350.1 hypothetical protein JI435_024720 [Parastagonospora nodorum SN15]KAH3994566.1 hypothetical protein HBI10_183200 [Parastagonospora nodorum]KAH4014037.1 hypothetical protein HBI13_175300 [Parastagonospora nodorum]KAH4021954.1 hypothetical protein HBI09_174330 [Parastagonospora nodorum]